MLRRHTISRAVHITLLALATATGIYGCDSRNAYVPPPPPKVTVGAPHVGPVTEYMEFSGTIAAVESVDITARVTGTLRSAQFRDGSTVHKGDPLFIIEPEPYQAALQRAEAELEVQQAALARAETELARSRKLLTEKAGSETDVVKWQQQRDSAKANISRAKAQIETARIDLGYTRITAPFDGQISRRFADPGNVVGPGAVTRLATIVRRDQVHVYFNINERDLLRLMAERPKPKTASAPTMPLELALADEDGFPHAGKLDYADPGVDPATGTMQLRGLFPNPSGRLLPGLFARIRVAVGQSDKAMMVPDRAIGQDQSGSYVIIVNAQNIAEQRAVVLGSLHEGYRVVTKGLTAEDRVVVNGIQRARPGSPVDPTPAPDTGQPAGKPAS
ncbi:efflux RND transporter periplasmic adaptor subunit [Nitratidesulfovibrio vulgaris]|uniref:Efflux transporter, RND family, MFP subunit n=1 Tax=Nitratidesulfovibrio vulgaris (strain DP4) TaxID=391774 RepID=A0A0H3A4E2_NITV4|nr:efflux RND transporter periplasmic adaptor subunit [Nitratidesulfovibrio vulgaris]ABM27166.1 efflux transporter, RND family, MFP subunit [Nitratidesulfovibrio vulgaris DP4]GEB78721.1 MexE family multidrug efflux RND transporter periplasmic adaptor subunit [Desulfovibrio desulfuricans]HBW15058.1 efflux RND transporter periplasmic adaptor subunit [Desulfovibrio sp.]